MTDNAEKKIEITVDEALTMLRHLSNVEGYLMWQTNTNGVIEALDYTVEILVERLERM